MPRAPWASTASQAPRWCDSRRVATTSTRRARPRAAPRAPRGHERGHGERGGDDDVLSQPARVGEERVQASFGGDRPVSPEIDRPGVLGETEQDQNGEATGQAEGQRTGGPIAERPARREVEAAAEREIEEGPPGEEPGPRGGVGERAGEPAEDGRLPGRGVVGEGEEGGDTHGGEREDGEVQTGPFSGRRSRRDRRMAARQAASSAAMVGAAARRAEERERRPRARRARRGVARRRPRPRARDEPDQPLEHGGIIDRRGRPVSQAAPRLLEVAGHVQDDVGGP